MLDAKVKELINDQINKEFYSSYLYLDISNFYADKGLEGFANWYMVQAMEERDHALLFLKYLQNNGVKPEFNAINKPDKSFANLLDPLEAGYEHEQYVTGLIHGIYAAANDVNDFRTIEFLTWFVKEQGEEETNSENLIKKMKMFGDDPKSLYLFDTELAARVYAAPSLVI